MILQVLFVALILQHALSEDSTDLLRNKTQSSYQACVKIALASVKNYLKSSSVKSALTTVSKEIPSIVDRETLALQMQKRREVWNSLNPKDPDNFPVPENKNGVDWMKAHLQDLLNGGGEFKDQIARELTQGKRSEIASKLLQELEEIAKRGYPNKDTLLFADNVAHFFDQTKMTVISHSEFLKHLSNKGISVSLPADFFRKDNQLMDIIVSEAGKKGMDAIMEQEKLLIKAIEKELKAQGKSIDVRRELREFEFKAVFGEQPEYMRIADGQGRALIEKVAKNSNVILAPGDLSDRGLAEAVLFKLEPAGLIKNALKADGDVMRSKRFLRHDFLHALDTMDDPISQKLTSMDTEAKRNLLMRIDSISNKKQRELAEFALMSALRESPQRTIFSNQGGPIAGIQRKYQVIKETKLSEQDAGWLMDWWRANLPVD